MKKIALITACSLILISQAHARDTVGDLNAHFLEPGDFTGSYKVMGKSKVPVSIAVGGFIKAVAITDTNSERDDTYFRPSLLNAADTEGNTQINANFSRWYLDGRAKLTNDAGEVRGYLETDFYKSSYRMRHAYLTWSKDQYSVLAGQSWTTFQDAAAYPEMIYELGPAGGILLRQGQFRFTHQFNERMSYAVAIEDPSSNDIQLGANNSIQSMPDITGNFRWNLTDKLYMQFSGLVRELGYQQTAPLNKSDSAIAYGTHISGAWVIGKRDKLAWSFLYGDGIGRYLIGASANGGGDSGYIDSQGDLQTRQAMGGYASYKHFWSDQWRSSLIAGMSDQDKVNDIATTNTDLFENARFISANVFWHPNKVINTGVELTYGESEFTQGNGTDSRDNTRISFVIQLF